MIASRIFLDEHLRSRSYEIMHIMKLVSLESEIRNAAGGRNCSFLTLFAVSFPVFAAMATVFFYLHVLTGSVGRRILLVVLVDTLYRTSIITSSTVLPLNLFVNLSLAPVSLFLTNGPDLGVCLDCWVSAEFLRAPIPRKWLGSSNTTTR